MAEISYRPAQVLTITNPAPNLDSIDVIFLDHKPGSGRLIVRCYSQAWTAWWGAMGDHHTVRTFVLKSPADYVASALLYGPGDLQRARPRKLQSAHVERIVRAIQDALRAEAASPQAPAPQAVFQPLLYETPHDLWKAFHGGTRFVLHYHGRTYDVTHMQRREKVVYVQPPGMPVKVFPDGRSAEGDNGTIWLAALTSPAPNAAPHQGADALRDALSELVALKDLKDSIERWVRDETTGKQWPNMPYNERMAASDDYARRKPLAWDAARAALAQHQSPQQGEQHERS